MSCFSPRCPDTGRFISPVGIEYCFLTGRIIRDGEPAYFSTEFDAFISTKGFQLLVDYANNSESHSEEQAEEYDILLREFGLTKAATCSQ